ncbi:MAG: very short patch repair endonuclease [Lachnospiraceae bacterium]|nr:very short patch repair endonuclease [Butyrivibrio sp.]MCM1412022.1 very short patch repair endonuclease [Lachnospiraceae bacterium]
MSRIKGKDTGIEVALRKALWAKGYRYRKNCRDLPGRPDIVLPKYRIAIFCDGEFFHGKDWEILKPRLAAGKNPDYWIPKIERNIERDREKEQELFFADWTVIRFWGKDILKKTDECVRIIEECIFDQKMAGDDGMFDRV